MTTQEILKLQAAIEQSNVRRAAELTMAEKFKLGADLFDDGIRWLKQIIKAEQPELSDEQVDQELDRRRAIKRRIEERGHSPVRRRAQKSSFDALVQVIRVLQTHDVPYMIVGAFSSNAYGYPRATKDADIVVQYSEGLLATICASLVADFKLDPQAGCELMTGSSLNISLAFPPNFEIELFRLGEDPHHEERFARRRRLVLPELQIEAVIPTAEDVVIQKLRW